MKNQPILFNGEICQPKDINYRVMERAWKYGDGIFETILVKKDQPIYWEGHFERLSRSLKEVCMTAPENFEAELRNGINQLLQSCSDEKFTRMRVQCWRMPGGHYSPATDEIGYLVECFPLEKDPWRSGHMEKLCLYRELKFTGQNYGHLKSSNALHLVMAARHAHTHGADDAIIVTDDYLSECTRANLFLVMNDELYFNPDNIPFVRGTMAKRVLDIAEREGIPVHRQPLHITQLFEADEVFVTNAIRGITSVQAVEAKEYETFELAQSLRKLALQERDSA